MLAGNCKAHSFPPDFESGTGRHSGIAVCFTITKLVGGPDGKGMDCNSIALHDSNVFDSRTDLQNIRCCNSVGRVPGS